MTGGEQRPGPGQHWPGCSYPPEHLGRHPCGTPHVPGSPCDYCGQPTPASGGPCPDCWQPITIADFKALMADAGLDTVVTPAPPKTT